MKEEAAVSEDALLEALADRDWLSGAELADRFQVSRTAVWKAVARLRSLGYGIEASAWRGYRMTSQPDRLSAAEIRHTWSPRRFRGEIVHHETLDSTSLLAGDLARAGAAEGTIVIAEQQTAGRGRFGRQWVSPPGKNLYLSIILRPPMAPIDVPCLTLVAAVAVREAVAETIAKQAAIKWPNDVLIAGRKTAGILTELEAEAERVRFVILGIGVNLNSAVSDFPSELRRKATSLRIASSKKVDRARFTGLLLARLEAWYEVFCRDGFAAVRGAYEAYHCLPGREVQVEGGVSGVVQGIDAGGALLIESAKGVVRVAAGEVTLRGAYRA